MRTTRILVGLLCTLGACGGNETDVQSLATSRVQMSLYPGFPAADTVVVNLARPDQIVGGVAQPKNCLRVHDDTTVMVNDTAGALDDPGGYYSGDNGCTSSKLSARLGTPLPTIIDVTVDDGYPLHASVVRTAGGGWQVTACTALACSVSN